MGNIEQAVKFMVDIANDDKHGYDQVLRNGPNYDCSSLLGSALNKAGFKVSKFSWTGNLRKQLLECGFKEISVNSERKRGDIFLSENRHVVMCTDSNNIVHATINELGKISGGKSGDQTGKEICIRTFYTPSYGWDYHFRYEDEKPVAPTITPVKDVKCTKYALAYNNLLANTYEVTASWLNVRNGAGTSERILTSIPKGTKVRCYGYYTLVGTTKWYVVQFTYKNVRYTGFVSSKHLK